MYLSKCFFLQKYDCMLVKIQQSLLYSLIMNVVEQDFELGFTLFKTPASFLMNANLIPCASFRYGRSERYRCLACWHWIGSERLWITNYSSEGCRIHRVLPRAGSTVGCRISWTGSGFRVAGGAQRGGFNRYFSERFCQCWQSFYFGAGLGAGLSFYGVQTLS